MNYRYKAKQDFVSMESFLKQHDLVYNSAIERWLDGIPMANGDIGGVLWGDGNPLRMTLDKYDVWELRRSGLYENNPEYNYKTLRDMVAKKEFDKAAKLFSLRGASNPDHIKQTSLPLPRLQIDMNGAVKSFNAHLSLYNAQAAGQIKFLNGLVNWMAYIHTARNLVIIRLEKQWISELCNIDISIDHLAPKVASMLKKWGYSAPVKNSAKNSGSFWKRFLQEVDMQQFGNGCFMKIRNGYFLPLQHTMSLLIRSRMQSHL